MIAYLDYRSMLDGGWEVVFEASEPGLIGGTSHISHDNIGLIVESRNSDWVRVVYGYTAVGDVRLGWVPASARTSPVRLVRRPDSKPGAALRESGEIQFFDGANGRRIPFRLVPDGAEDANYKLDVLQIKADWIQVAIEVANDHPCSDYADAKVQRSTTAWVRRYDTRGRY